MHRRVPWRDPAVLQLMQTFPTDEIDTGEKLARRISEMTGASVSRSTVNRQLQEMRRAPNLAAPQDDDDDEEEIDDLRAEFAEVCNIVFRILCGFSFVLFDRMQ